MRELATKAPEIAEREFVNNTDKSVKLWSKLGGYCRSTSLWPVGNRRLDCVSDLVGGFVHVAEPMRFIDDHKIPRRLADVLALGRRELEGTENDSRLLKRVEVPALHLR